MNEVKIGDTIRVDYTGRLEDGTVFDSTERHGQPLEFTVGEGSIIKGFDEAVVGMKVGEEKEVTIPPEDAYGPYNHDLVRDLPRKIFPADQEIKPDMVFVMAMQDGCQVPVRIDKVMDDQVRVDLNSPLAGKTLIFKIKLVGFAE
jgi:FKBP-type peptidyl-prolyl cis-trans isomerase 2